MRRTAIIVSCLFFILGITGCSRKTTQNSFYPNLVGNLGQVAESDDAYFIIAKGFLFTVDKQTGEASPACRNATCAHQEGACVYNHAVECTKNYNGKILLICGNSQSRTLPAIYEMNPDTYTLSTYLNLDDEPVYFEFYQDQLIYSHMDSNDGKGGWSLLNPYTNQKKLLLDRPGLLPYIGVKDEFLFVTTTELDLYKINMESGERTHILEDCRDCVLYQDRLYYLRYDPQSGAANLYTSLLDGSDETMLFGGIWTYQIYENQIYYNDSSNRLVKTGLDEIIYEVLLEDVEGYRFILLPGVNQIIVEVKNGFSRINLDGSGHPEMILSSEDFANFFW